MGRAAPDLPPTASLVGKCPAPSIATAGTAGLPSLLATTPLTRDPHSQNFMVPATTGPLSLHGSPSTDVRGGRQGWFLSGDGGTDRSPSSPTVSEALRDLLAVPCSRGPTGATIPQGQVSFRGFLSQPGLCLTGRASPELCSLLRPSSGVPAAPWQPRRPRPPLPLPLLGLSSDGGDRRPRPGSHLVQSVPPEFAGDPLGSPPADPSQHFPSCDTRRTREGG